MFNPSAQDVRRFFCGVYRKHLDKQILTPLENLAARWLVEHPEYHADLSNEAAALEKTYPPEGGKTNPFLHLSMHLSISEQLQIDQPAGVKAVFEALMQKTQDPHAAQHILMEGLGEMLWQAQRSKTAPNPNVYLEAAKKAGGLA